MKPTKLIFQWGAGAVCALALASCQKREPAAEESSTTPDLTPLPTMTPIPVTPVPTVAPVPTASPVPTLPPTGSDTSPGM